MQSNQYDVIVLGSGMGGLTTASILAQLAKKRVLVLEKHFKLGGFTHSFRRKKYEWDVGVHYVGDMDPTSMTRGIMDLVTKRGVQWHKMNTPFERFMFPTGTFDVHDDQKKFIADLKDRFPHEKESIDKYFKDLVRAQSWMIRWFVSKQYTPWIAKAMQYFGSELAGTTTSDYLGYIQDPLLKAILTAQWPDFGSPPSKSAFGFHATVAADFLKGGYYPIGGSQQISKHAAAAIEEFGGDCLVNHEVLEVLVEKERACGVRALHKGKEVEFRAPCIVSNIGAASTFSKLVPTPFCPHEKEQAKQLKRGVSANIVFVGLKEDPRSIGCDDRNYWIYSRLDHDTHARIRDGEPERIDGAFVSFGSLRDPEQTNHTAQIVHFSEATSWAEFADTKWKRRGNAYEDHKERIAIEMLNYVDKHLPGFRGLVDYYELSTPLTVQSFTSHPHGQIYGQPCDAARLFQHQWRIGTSLKGLYLTGSDVGTPGVNGAMMAGVMTAGKLMGPLGLAKIFMTSHRSSS